jgi:hypothetical protein
VGREVDEVRVGEFDSVEDVGRTIPGEEGRTALPFSVGINGGEADEGGRRTDGGGAERELDEVPEGGIDSEKDVGCTSTSW